MVYDTERNPVGEEARLREPLSAGWMAQDLVIDPWSGLSHKSLVGPGSRNAQQNLAPSWVGSKNIRRLNAYRILAGYMANVSRAFLPSGRSYDEILAFREYGDALTLRDMIRTSVLGDETQIRVDKADNEPEEPTAPEEPGERATPEELALFAAEKKEYDDAVVEHTREQAECAAAQELQGWFDEWADLEKFPLKLVETENDACGLGDGVFYAAWSNRKNRVCLHFYDPGFYFPALDSVEYEDYPERVHLAWEEEDDEGERWVRRITFELVDLPEGQSVRYPYAGADDELSTVVCTMTDARWQWRELGDRTVNDLIVERAEIKLNDDGVPLRDYPLGIDFIPLVHVPNTVSLKHHFGESVLTRVAQILDDIGNNDTDLAVTADLAGAPPLAIEGTARPADGKLTTYGPGSVLFGKAQVIDTSHSLDALMKRGDALLERLSVNGRVPKEVLGRVKMQEVPSGIALLLTFGPFRALINEMRMVRRDKYALLFRMVQRLAMVGANGGPSKPGSTLKAGPTSRVELKFGSYLPTDLKELIGTMVALLNAHGISRPSALKILVDGGLDLDGSLKDEIERIEHEDFEGAAELADALGTEVAAAEYLGRVIPEPLPTAPPGPAPGTLPEGEVVPAGGEQQGGPAPAP